MRDGREGKGWKGWKGEVRGRVANARYSRARRGCGVDAEWNNRWQVLDQTGGEMVMSTEEPRQGRAEGGTETRKERDVDNNDTRRSNSTIDRQMVRQPGMTGMENEQGRGGEERGEQERESLRNVRGRGYGDGVTMRKRNLDERSPGQHDNIRTNRPRLDEFHVGALCVEIDKKMRTGMAEIVEGAPEE